MELYFDPVATTSRAVAALCEHDDLAITLHRVALMKGEQHQPPLSALNPNRQVPVLVDDDFVLTEASAILRYLARRTRSVLYPEDIRQQARIDELIAWFETNLYRDFGFQFVYPQLLPHHRRRDEAGNDATIAWGRSQSIRWLDILDAHFLGHGKPYLCGEAPSLADLMGGSIISLGDLVGCDFDNWRASGDGSTRCRRFPAGR
ncbi:MAG: glutathione S-transferase family protein [Burkholderiaceae bacterium]